MHLCLNICHLIKVLTKKKEKSSPPTISDPQSDDEESKVESDELPTVLPLLPVPSNLESPKDELCDVCKGLGLSAEQFVVDPNEDKAWNSPLIEKEPVADILKRSHCPLCRLIITALGGPKLPSFENGEPVWVTLDYRTEGSILSPDRDNLLQIRNLCPYARKLEGGSVSAREQLPMFPEITLLANDSPVLSTSLLARPIQQDKIDFRMVRKWIAICENDHGQDCNKSMMREHQLQHPVDIIPEFRLVDVIDNCLVRGVNVGRTKYVTLSYVWGRIDFLRTLKSTVGRFEQHGALKRPEFYKKIPWTIRDAMQVTKKIGLRYLWVDSLCIVQDDDSGKKEEAIRKMDLVYGASFITILAATGNDANAGLPGVRPGTRNFRQPIEQIAPGFRLAFKPRHHDYISSSTYYTRSWTFQEHLFSRRNLIFIGGQVVFNCQRTDQLREDAVLEGVEAAQFLTLDRDANDIGNFEGLIQSYSELSLSFEADIYSAFAGVARYITLELQTNLCHGIPEAYFDWFLLWATSNTVGRRQCAPSWSWSGWIGGGWPNMWNWYSRNIKKVRNALQHRTWIIWYQRVRQESTECVPVWAYNNADPSGQRNFYGGPIKSRFPFDCSQTTPTPRKLLNAPEYCKDILNPHPGSGFLQFWTVSVTFYLKSSPNADTEAHMTPSKWRSRLGIFGKSGRELGHVVVSEDWQRAHVPGEYEFILLCEGRDERPEWGAEDKEEGWKYMVMLIERHGDWNERVAVGSIEKNDLSEALAEGAVWKEIVLG